MNLLAFLRRLRPFAGKSPATPVETGLPSALRHIIRPQAAMNWMSPQLASITPAYIEQTLRGAMGGNHVQQWELFDLMEDTWPRLLKNLGEIKDDAISYHWKLEAHAEEDTPPTDSAQERCKLVRAAVTGMRPERDRDENGFDKTLFDVLDAWAKGLSVLEVDWEHRDGPAGDIIAPRTTTWVHPRNYAWSNDGWLGLAVNQDTSYIFAPRQQQVVPFPEHKFLIALCKSRSTHASMAALLRPLAWWWCAANFSAEWLLNFAQVFGLPIRWAHYREGSAQTLIDKIADMLENMGSAGWGLFPEGTTLELKEASKSGDALPQAHMLDRADTQCDLLLLRQTLTSEAGDQGSRALGEVHERGRDKEVSGAAMFAADVLQQLVASILILNYGDADEAPRFCPEPREEEDTKANSEIIQAAVNMGVKVPLKWAHKKLSIPLPQEDEEILSMLALPAAPGVEGEGVGGAGAADVQATALNGAQVTALADLAEKVATGQLPFDTGLAIATAAFPMVPPATITKIFSALRKFKPAPPPGSEPPPAPAVNGNGKPKAALEPPENDARFKASAAVIMDTETDLDRIVTTAVADAVGAREQWLAPLNAELDRLARLAKNQKLSDAELTTFLEAATRRLPELFNELKPEVLADSLEAAIGTAVIQGVRDEIAESK